MIDGLARPDWQAEAACRGATAIFFPEQGGDFRTPVAICQGCPVRQQCYDHAMGSERVLFGVWGGTTERERKRLRQRERERARTLRSPTPATVLPDSERPQCPGCGGVCWRAAGRWECPRCRRVVPAVG